MHTSDAYVTVAGPGDDPPVLHSALIGCKYVHTQFVEYTVVSIPAIRTGN